VKNMEKKKISGVSFYTRVVQHCKVTWNPRIR
jgi:hypothetical protein